MLARQPAPPNHVRHASADAATRSAATTRALCYRDTIALFERQQRRENFTPPRRSVVRRRRSRRDFVHVARFLHLAASPATNAAADAPPTLRRPRHLALSRIRFSASMPPRPAAAAALSVAAKDAPREPDTRLQQAESGQ